MNERAMIIEIETHVLFEYIKELSGEQALNGFVLAERIADELIAAGIGDVAEWKRRAEVAERALEYAVSEYRCDECPCIDCNAEIRGSQECVNLIAKTYKKQAEREIDEEEKK